MGHHLFPRSVAKKLKIAELSGLRAPSWYPDVTEGSGKLHQRLHRLLIEQGVPFHGSKFTGTEDDFWRMAYQAYDDISDKGYLKIPGIDKKILKDITPKEALEKIKEWRDKGEFPTRNNY